MAHPSTGGHTPPERQFPLTGRADELAHLRGLLPGSGAAGRDGRLVTVVGEPGIGKTRLLRELAAAAASGAYVGWGGATEFERRQPFGVFHAAFEAFRPELDPRALAQVDAESLALARAIWPGLPADGPVAARPVSGERFRLHRAVGALLDGIAADRPVLLVLDDLHWADEGSVELCRHLLRYPPRGPVLIALAYRPRQVPATLGAAVAEAVAEAPASRVTAVQLPPLRFADADALLAPSFDRATREQLYRLSEGNPLYLESLARSLGTTADRPAVLDPAQPVQLALGREVAALAPGPLRVAHAAAIVGDAFEPGVVAEVAQVAEDEVLDGLDDLVARDLVRPVGAGYRHQFRHPLVRSAAYQSAGAGWRIAGHARAAAALRRRGAPATDRAHHVERSCGHGDTEAIGVLVAAAEAAADTVPAVAAHWLRTALDLLPADGPATPDRTVLLDQLARALGVAGQLVESRQVMHELLAVLPRGSQRRAHAACFCAMVQRLLGEYAEANAMLRAELDDLPDPAGATAVIIKVGLASGYMLGGGFTAERDWAAEAVATAREVGDQPLLAAARTVQALGILMGVRAAGGPAPDRRHAVAYLAEAAAIVDALPDPALVDHIDAFATLGSAEYLVERMADAERHLTRLLRIARASGRIHLQTNIALGLGSLYGRTGRLRQAQSCFDDALDSALLTGSAEQYSLSQASRSWILSWTGDLTGAGAAAAEAAARAGTLPGWFSVATRYRLAYLRYYSDDPAGCVQMLVSGCGGPELSALDPLSRLTAYSVMAAAEVQRGDEDAALGWAERARDAAAGSPLSGHAGLAALTMATALADRDPATALTCADQAIAAFLRVQDSIFAGFAELTAGRALAAQQDPAAARARWARARELFTAAGAELFTGAPDRELRRMNARLPRNSGPVLTPRELEVARCVAAGLTNRQIGERLYLSPRTVETHVGKVFAKLDVSTRSAVVHALDGYPE
jgi:DNA-binding CsgD family transcriptional regulator